MLTIGVVPAAILMVYTLSTIHYPYRECATPKGLHLVWLFLYHFLVLRRNAESIKQSGVQ